MVNPVSDEKYSSGDSLQKVTFPREETVNRLGNARISREDLDDFNRFREGMRAVALGQDPFSRQRLTNIMRRIHNG